VSVVFVMCNSVKVSCFCLMNRDPQDLHFFPTPRSSKEGKLVGGKKRREGGKGGREETKEKEGGEGEEGGEERGERKGGYYMLFLELLLVRVKYATGYWTRYLSKLTHLSGW